MATDLPTSAAITSSTVTNANQKLNFAALRDFIANMLGTDSSDKPAARALLGVAPRAARIDVASVAGTVDLTANAPNTDDIRITGALAITAFTVAAGRVLRVTAGGAFSLVNGANLVTQTGANVVVVAGDTFILRATAANTVEVLSLTRKQQFGFGMTWQNMLASRAAGTIYTNTSGGPIFVQGDLYSTAGTLLTFWVYPGGSIPAGVEVDVTQMAANVSGSVGGIVPNGDSYQITQSAGTPTMYRWAEFRP